MIKKIPASAALLVLTFALSGFFMAVLSKTNIIEGLRLKASDGLFSLRASLSPASPGLSDVLVIGVDDESFRRMNRAWPWGREVFAFFTEKIGKYEPRSVSFDFVFGGRGPNPEADEWWAKTIADSKDVILASYFGPDGVLVAPYPMFAKAAAGVGFVDKPRDIDGASRKARPLVATRDGGRQYSLASFAAYHTRDGDHPSSHIRFDGGGVRYEDASSKDADPVGSVWAQTDRQQRIWIAFRYRPSRFQYLPFWRVAQEQVEPEKIKNKIILVGPVSPLFHDIHSTPLGSMPGVFINANELMTALDRDFVREPLAGWEIPVILLLGAVFTFAILRFSFWVQSLIYLGVSVLLYALIAVLFCKWSLLIEPFTLLTVLLINFVTVASWKALKTFLDNIALQRQVITDSLTGLYGHRFLTLKLGSVFLHAATTKTEFCVAMLDADHFKKVNDTYGHDVGNVVLVGISKVMKQHVRRQDIAARFGGEEFCVIMIGTDTKGAREGLERMRKAIEEMEFSCDKGKFKVTISSGICSNQHPAVKNSDDMLKLADKALYEAKTQGRNRVCAA